MGGLIFRKAMMAAARWLRTCLLFSVWGRIAPTKPRLRRYKFSP